MSLARLSSPAAAAPACYGGGRQPRPTTPARSARPQRPGRVPGPLRPCAFIQQQGKAQQPQPAAAGDERGQPSVRSLGWISKGAHEPLQLSTVDLPATLAPHEVEIQVTHNGICHSDLHMIGGEWGISVYPFIPGHEIVGTLAAKGSEVEGMEIGERLGVGWIRDSCARCYACIQGKENICVKGYEGTILNGNNGGFQERFRVPAAHAHKIPDGLSSEHAAPLLCAGLTVYAPLRQYMVAGQSVGVLGIGGLGHLAIQYANAMGGVVTALDLGTKKEEEVKQLGAVALCDTTDPAHLQAWAGKLDVIINCASANVNTGMLLDLLANGGTLIQVGIPGGGQMQLPIQNMVFGQKKVAGSIVGGRADMQAMLKLSAAKGIVPYIETLPLSKVNEGLEKVARGEAHYRVVLSSDKPE